MSVYRKESITDEEIERQEDTVDRIQNAWGSPRRGPSEDGFYDSDGNLYRFIAVVKGGDFDVLYDGKDKWDEAAEYADTSIYDSVVDADAQGVWVVVAIVDTTNGEVYYPEYRVRVPERANGNLSEWGV
jgi:hypothetical protein